VQFKNTVPVRTKMVQQWITFFNQYFQVAHIPVYIKPDQEMLLLRLDYMGFYFPRIHFLKFGFIRSLLSTNLRSDTRHLEYEVSPDKRVDCIDLTRDFLTQAQVEKINYQEMPHCMYYLLTGNLHEVTKYKLYYEPLVPFFQFLGLEQEYLDKM
jgi:hypothetical protein